MDAYFLYHSCDKDQDRVKTFLDFLGEAANPIREEMPTMIKAAVNRWDKRYSRLYQTFYPPPAPPLALLRKYLTYLHPSQRWTKEMIEAAFSGWFDVCTILMLSI
jgi:hypothetical protein